MPDLKAKLTVPGWFLLGSAILSLPLGLILLSPLLTQSGLFVLLLVAAAVPLARLNLSGVDCHVSAPETVVCNDAFEIEIRLHNPGRILTAFDIDADSSILRSGPVRFSRAQPGADASCAAVTRFTHRGLYAECSYTLRSHFPWGLVACERSGTIPLNLVVSPPPRVIHDLEKILEQGAGLSGCRHTRSEDLLGRFSAVREFRPGDRIKLVSWPFSARQGKLIVKEMEQPSLNQCKIVFHSYQPPRSVLTRQSFETALSMLAGLFTFFHENAIPFRFMDCSPAWHDITVMPDEAVSIRQALACLATAEMTTLASMDSVLRVLDAAATHAGTLIIVSNAPLRFWEKRLPHSLEPRLCMDNQRIRISTGTPA
jgi:uncharacterized protein (DUF58 family)